MILIIGSEGFIGKHLFDSYSKSADVIGCHTNKSKSGKNLEYVDKSNPDFDSIFQKYNFTVCINASGSKGVGFSFEHPALDYQLNVQNTKTILEAIRQYNSDCKFINLSSAAVYGNPLKLPIVESDSPNPISPYGKHKLMSEVVCETYHTKHAIKTCSLRIFSVYGPNLKKQLLWDVANKIKDLSGNSISLFGTGKESRDYIYIEDLIQAIDLIVRKGDFSATCYNVANGIEVEIQEITQLLVKKIDPKIRIEFSGDEKKGDPKNWLADVSKLKKLGYIQQVTLINGVSLYSEWLKKI